MDEINVILSSHCCVEFNSKTINGGEIFTNFATLTQRSDLKSFVYRTRVMCPLQIVSCLEVNGNVIMGHDIKPLRQSDACTVSNLTVIGSDNGLSPDRRQAIIWTNAGLLLIGPLGTNFSEILIGIHTFSFKKMYLKMSSAKWRPFCLGHNVLIFFSVSSPVSALDDLI